MNRLCAALAVFSLVGSPVAAQTAAKSAPATPAKRPAAAKAAYKAPRTPWGDPDVTGTYTNKYENGTPFEKPDTFGERKIEDVDDEELKEILQERQQQAIDRLPFVSGDPEGRIGPPHHWREMFDITKGSRPWLVTTPVDGKIPAQLPEVARRSAARQAARIAAGRGRGQFDSYEDRSLYDRCITRGLPGSMIPAIYGSSYEILQGPGYVAIRYEMIHETRVIPLDNHAHVGKNIRLDMGDARGHWEGDTLVVETTNFTDRSAYRNANPETLRLVERFTASGPNRVEWAVTVDDPTTWAQAWTFEMPLTKDASEAVFEYGCHEGNYALANMLSAARAEEREAAASAKSAK